MEIEIENFKDNIFFTPKIGKYFYLDGAKIGITSKITKDYIRVTVEEDKFSYLNYWARIHFYKKRKDNIG